MPYGNFLVVVSDWCVGAGNVSVRPIPLLSPFPPGSIPEIFSYSLKKLSTFDRI